MTGAVESKLRQLAGGTPSPEAWGALCTEIDGLSDADLDSVGWLDAALAHWPSDLRVMPDGWWRKLCAGDGRTARLARLREIPGIEPAFDGDWDFQGRTMWAQLGPKRDVVLTAEGLEAHRAGGDVSLMDAAGAQPWLPLIDGTDDYGEVADAAFDPSGKHAVVAWADQALRVRAFDTDTGDQLWAWRHRSKQELADTPWVLIEVSPNGKWVALLSAITRGVVVLDAARGRKQAKLSAPGLNTFRFDAAGDSILTATSKGELARWRLPDGERLWSTRAHEDAIDALAVSPAGEVATLAGQSLKLWTTSETGPTLGREIALPENSSGDLVYHPRRGLLIFGVSPEALQIVEVASGAREIVGLQSVRHAWSRDGADLVLVALNTAVSKAAVWHWCPDGDWTPPSPLSTRVNPLEREAKRYASLAEAVECDDIDVVRYLLADKKIDPNRLMSTTRSPNFPLRVAAERCHHAQRVDAPPVAILRLLLDHGADPNRVEKAGDQNALHIFYTMMYDDLASAPEVTALVERWLIEAGVDLWAVASSFGTKVIEAEATPAVRAAAHERMDVLRRLDRFPAILLHGAALRNRREAVRFLLERGCDMHAPDQDGYTAIHRATLAPEALGWLLAAGGRIDVRNEKPGPWLGFTPIHYAAMRAMPDVLPNLIAAGAELNARAATGLTPLHLAAEWGNLAEVRALIDLGADVSARADDGRTAQDLAGEQRSTEIPYRLETREADRAKVAAFLATVVANAN